MLRMPLVPCAALVLVVGSLIGFVEGSGNCVVSLRNQNQLGDVTLNASFSTTPMPANGVGLGTFFLSSLVCSPNPSNPPLAGLQFPSGVGSNTSHGSCNIVNPAAFDGIFAAGSMVNVTFGFGPMCFCSGVVPSAGQVAGVNFTLDASRSTDGSSFSYMPTSCSISFTTVATSQQRNGVFALTYVVATTEIDNADDHDTVHLVSVLVPVLVVLCLIGVGIFCFLRRRQQQDSSDVPFARI